MGLCKKLFIGDGITALITLILGLSLGLTVGSRNITSTFFSRCKKFNEYDCQKVWDAFQQAYVNKDPCKVPVEAYDPLIAAAPFKHQCNKTLFWSKINGVVHDLTAKRNDCFVTLEDTLLGSVLDNLTWCGKEGSNDTFTTGCPGWSKCENNPVRSFWNRSSAAFADVACGNVTAMLNGSINTPFNPTSIFASIEVPRFKASRVKKLNVVMVLQKNNISNCTDPSLKNLTQVLDKGIIYSCKDVSESQIQECGAKPEIACGACW